MKKKFRFGACLIALLLAMSTFAQAPTFAYAAEKTDKELVDQALTLLTQPGELTPEEMVEIGTPNNQFSAFDATAFYDTLASMDMDAFTQLKYEVPTVVEQTSALNYQYDSMKLMMQDMGYGDTFEFSVPEMNTGYTADITTAFAETYGDLSSKFDSDVSLPEGWTMDEIMSSAQAKRDQYASDIKTTKEYSVVKNSISNNTSVVKATEVIEQPDLQSALSLQTFITDSIGSVDDGTWIKEEWSMQDSANMDRVLQGVRDNATSAQESWSTDNTNIQTAFNGNKNAIN